MLKVRAAEAEERPEIDVNSLDLQCRSQELTRTRHGYQCVPPNTLTPAHITCRRSVQVDQVFVDEAVLFVCEEVSAILIVQMGGDCTPLLRRKECGGRHPDRSDGRTWWNLDKT